MASRRQALKPKRNSPTPGQKRTVDKWGDRSDYVPTELEKAAVAAGAAQTSRSALLALR